MMDMNSRKRVGGNKLAQDMQQDNRITATGQADAKRFTAGQMGGEKLADPRRQIS